MNWWEESTLVVGQPDVTREKSVTDGGDVAIDGWTYGDGGAFRVVVGTLIPLTGVVATIAAVSSNVTFSAPSAAYTPAGGATPPEYKTTLVSPLSQPLVASPTQFTWTIGSMPGGSSAGFDFVGVPIPGATGPLVVRIELTGLKAGC